MGRYHRQNHAYKPDKRAFRQPKESSYFSKKQIKQLKEDQNFDPYSMKVATNMINSGVPAYMAVGITFMFIAASMGGVAVSDSPDSIDDVVAPAQSHNSYSGNHTAPAYNASAPVNASAPAVSEAPAKEMQKESYEPREIQHNASKEKNLSLEERVFKETKTVEKHTMEVKSEPQTRGSDTRADVEYNIKDISNAPTDNDNIPITDGEYVVWMKGDRNWFDLAILNLRTNKTVIVNGLGANDDKPYDLGTGELIVYDIYKDGRAFYKVNEETGEMTKILENVAVGEFTSNGSKIFFQNGNSSSGNYDLKIFDENKNEIKDLGIDVDDAFPVSLSDNHCGYEVKENDIHTCKIIDINTLNVEPLSNELNFHQRWINIKGNSAYFLGSHDNGNNWDVYEKDLDNSQIIQKTTDGGSKHNLQFDGKNAVWEKDGDIHVYSVQDERQFKITDDEDGQGSPWTSDGKIVFVGGKAGDPEVFLATLKDITPVPENHAPTLEDITDTAIDYDSGWIHNFGANDPDGDNITLSVEGDAFELIGEQVKLKDTYETKPGTYALKRIVEDEHGAMAEKVTKITVNEKGVEPVPNHAPIFKGLQTLYEINLGDEWSIDMKSHVSDPDGDVLTYRVTGDGDIIESKGNGVFGLKAGTAPGKYTVKLNATDEKGLGAETRLELKIIKTSDVDPDTNPDTNPDPSNNTSSGSDGLPWYVPVVAGVGAIGVALAAVFGRKKKNKKKK